jgi:polysaccharide export outer membrane protein
MDTTDRRLPERATWGEQNGEPRRNLRRWGILPTTALIAALVAGTAGCAFNSPPGRVDASMSPYAGVNEPYRIQVGDTIDVRFYKTPELNVRNIPVRHDGRISLDMIGDVEAAGLQPDELSQRLSEAYGHELQEPRITVIVRKFGGRVFVGGEVGSPKALHYVHGMTALQAIQSAGGFKDESSRQNVVLIRRGPEHYQGYRLFLEDALTGKDYFQDVALQPNDVVWIPRSRISNADLAVDQYIRQMLPIQYIPFAF